MSETYSVIESDFEGYPLEVGDRLLYRQPATGLPIATRIYHFEFWRLAGAPDMAVYTLREQPEYSPRAKEYRLTPEELRATCTRDPADTDRRKGERRGKKP